MARRDKSNMTTVERPRDIFEIIAKERAKYQKKTMGSQYDNAEERIRAAKQQDRPDTSTTL